MAPTIPVNELKEHIENDDALVIDVLGSDSYRQRHIPGAINVPVHDTEDFERVVEEKADGKDARIVVYCSDAECQASPTAARKLEEAGFSNVAHFKEGLKGWKDAGFDFEEPREGPRTRVQASR